MTPRLFSQKCPPRPVLRSDSLLAGFTSLLIHQTQQLLWQFGDRHYIAKRWAEAADWFLCGTNPIFSSMARSSHAKCFRKAALCHIQQREYARASAILRRCPGSDAATCYVSMLAAVHQGVNPSPALPRLQLTIALRVAGRRFIPHRGRSALGSNVFPLSSYPHRARHG